MNMRRDIPEPKVITTLSQFLEDVDSKVLIWEDFASRGPIPPQKPPHFQLQQHQQPQRQTYQQDDQKLLDNKPYKPFKDRFGKPFSTKPFDKKLFGNHYDSPHQNAVYTATPYQRAAHNGVLEADEEGDDVNNPEYDTHWVTVED